MSNWRCQRTHETSLKHPFNLNEPVGFPVGAKRDQTHRKWSQSRGNIGSTPEAVLLSYIQGLIKRCELQSSSSWAACISSLCSAISHSADSSYTCLPAAVVALCSLFCCQLRSLYDPMHRFFCTDSLIWGLLSCSRHITLILLFAFSLQLNFITMVKHLWGKCDTAPALSLLRTLFKRWYLRVEEEMKSVEAGCLWASLWGMKTHLSKEGAGPKQMRWHFVSLDLIRPNTLRENHSERRWPGDEPVLHRGAAERMRSWGREEEKKPPWRGGTPWACWGTPWRVRGCGRRSCAVWSPTCLTRVRARGVSPTGTSLATPSRPPNTPPSSSSPWTSLSSFTGWPTFTLSAWRF